MLTKRQLNLEIAKLERQVQALMDYLGTMLQKRDMHGIVDAANDIRVTEAELNALRRARDGND